MTAAINSTYLMVLPDRTNARIAAVKIFTVLKKTGEIPEPEVAAGVKAEDAAEEMNITI